MTKKRICLVTKWYPTKDNPYSGVFFKEQLFAVSEQFDFLVLHYYEERKNGFRGSVVVEQVNVENNTVEYDIRTHVPIQVYCSLAVKMLKEKLQTIKRGEQLDSKEAYRKKVLKDIFSNYDFGPVDALYCVDAQSEACTLQMISEILHKPFVVAEHAPFPWPGKILRMTEKRSIERANRFIAISYDKIRQVLLQNVTLPQTEYLGNLVDEKQFNIIKHDEPNHIKTFIIVAAHSYYKNYGLFIRIMNRLCEITNVDFKVLMVGYAANKGYSKDVEVLEEQIHTSSFADRVEMIPEVPHEEIDKYYAKADAFVMTSIQEGQPVSALEAACCGLPIFSTKCGGVEDYVDDRIGRLFPIVEIEQFARVLKDFLEDRISFDSQYIRNEIVNRYGRDAFIRNFANIFNQVIDSEKNKNIGD